MLRLVSLIALCLPLLAEAACPRSISGNYVAYGTKSSPTLVSSSGGLVTFGTLSSGVGTVSGTVFVYNEIAVDGNVVSGELGAVGNTLRYTYDGRCQGYAWENDEDPSKLQVDFLFVSDSGAQIVVVEGPRGVAKNSAGNPVTPLPSTWQNSSGQTGVLTLRKQ